MEPICIVVSGTKITLDAGPEIKYTVQKVLAKGFFREYKILFANQFEEVARRKVYDTLDNNTPEPLVLWACKQVMEDQKVSVL